MTLPVRFINHACVEISPDAKGEILITDPWFSGEVFNRSWNLLVDGDWSLVDWTRVRHIWISHEHPDHLNFPTLREIRDRVSGPLKVYFRAQQNKNVRDALNKMGFDVVELVPETEMRIGDKLSITTYWHG
jgi:L-ascorbate metabolism protein UlaG (beta-lactamase superfamily)